MVERRDRASYLIEAVAGAEVRTIEGLSSGSQHSLQRAWIE
jgi:aerobic-type carbon monoxide dehydrogenase small subunit (CoxS/CutS family)